MTFPILTGRALLLSLRGVRVGRSRLPYGAVLVFEGEGAVVEGNIVMWIHGDSMGALARKPLCAMMTKDHFFVTLGGHSAAEGHNERREPPCPESIESTLDFDR